MNGDDVRDEAQDGVGILGQLDTLRRQVQRVSWLMQSNVGANAGCGNADATFDSSASTDRAVSAATESAHESVRADPVADLSASPQIDLNKLFADLEQQLADMETQLRNETKDETHKRNRLSAATLSRDAKKQRTDCANVVVDATIPEHDVSFDDFMFWNRGLIGLDDVDMDAIAAQNANKDESDANKDVNMDVSMLVERIRALEQMVALCMTDRMRNDQQEDLQEDSQEDLREDPPKESIEESVQEEKEDLQIQEDPVEESVHEEPIQDDPIPDEPPQEQIQVPEEPPEEQIEDPREEQVAPEIEKLVEWMMLDDGWVTRDFYDAEMERRRQQKAEKDALIRSATRSKHADLVADHVDPVDLDGAHVVVGESSLGRPIVIVQKNAPTNQRAETKLDRQRIATIDKIEPIEETKSDQKLSQKLSQKQPSPSSATLINESISNILREDANPKMTDFIPNASENKSGSDNTISDASPKSSTIAFFLRSFNFVRALVTAAYALYTGVRALKDPFMIALGTRGLWIATIFFVCVDVVVAFTRAFPRIFWVFWDVSNWDPYAKSWNVWSLVADHDLIIDMVPLLANVVLRVYAYRATEIVQNPNARGFLSGNTTLPTDISDFANPTYHNLILLALFGVTLFSTIMIHAVRVCHVVTVAKKSIGLGVMIVIKAILLSYDLLINGLLIYQVLVFCGLQFLEITNLPIQLVLSVAIPSPLITLCTNVITNLPLHIFFLRMQLRTITTDVETNASQTIPVSFTRILKSSMRLAFHPIIVGILGTYAAYSVIALFIIMKTITSGTIDPIRDLQSGSVSPTTSENDGTPIQVLVYLVYLNCVVNYGIGVVAAIVYWVYVVVSTIIMPFVGSYKKN